MNSVERWEAKGSDWRRKSLIDVLPKTSQACAGAA